MATEAHTDVRSSCDQRQGLPQVVQPGTEHLRGRPRRDCPHPGHPHRHGQRVAYVKDRCRCLACTAANTAAARTAARRRALGRPSPFVDASDVRAHLGQLRRARIGYQQIARLSGTSATHIREIAGTAVRSGNRPPIRRIRKDLAARLLAIEPIPSHRAAHSHIDPTGTHRRLQALVAVGWSLGLLADRLGRTPAELRRTLTRTTITESTARHIRDLYDRLWATPPPRTTPPQHHAAQAARAHANSHDWAPPLAWDNIDTDPRPHPGPVIPSGQATADQLDEIAIERAIAGDGVRLSDLNFAEQTEVVQRLTERGTSIRDIAAQLATTARTVSRRRGSAARAA